MNIIDLKYEEFALRRPVSNTSSHCIRFTYEQRPKLSHVYTHTQFFFRSFISTYTLVTKYVLVYSLYIQIINFTGMLSLMWEKHIFLRCRSWFDKLSFTRENSYDFFVVVKFVDDEMKRVVPKCNKRHFKMNEVKLI